jgi:hypothetical protein
MNDSTPEISPLRQRMLEDMRLRKLAPKTQAGYVRAVRFWPVSCAAHPIPPRRGSA